MKKQEILDWLKRLGAKTPQTQARGGWVVCECPLGPWRHEAGKSSSEVFGVRVEAGESFCNCFACDWHGSQTDLIMELRQKNKTQFVKTFPFGELLQLISDAENSAELDGLNSPDIEEMLFGARKEAHEFPEWWLNSFPKAKDVGWALDYLRTGRVGCDPLTDDIIEFLDIRADSNEGRVCFPVRDFHGKLMGLHGRAIVDGVEPRYRMYLQQGHNNPQIWMGEHWIDMERPVVVVEGPFDLASVLRVYDNVATPLFANPNEAKIKRMANADTWITLFDQGTGGNKGREKFQKVLTDSVVYHAMPPKDAKDPGMMSVEQLRAALEPFVKLKLA